MIKEVSKDMLIGQILQADATIAPIMMACGMHELVQKINEFLANKNK